MDIVEILDRYAEGDEFQRPVEAAIEEISTLRQRVAELEKDCDEYHQVAVNHIHANEKLTAERDALMKQRDELLAALESNQSRGVRDVIVERRRQINIEGWSSHHDDQHSYGEMALAAGCYAMFGLCFNAGDPPKYWPWDKKWWKPSDKRRNLVKAAALIIAEIERIERAAIASVKEKQNAAD